MAQEKGEFEKKRKKEEKINFHKKLPVPIKIVIHNQDKTEQ